MLKALRLILITAVVSLILVGINIGIALAVMQVMMVGGILSITTPTVLVVYATVFAVYFRKTHGVSKCTRNQ